MKKLTVILMTLTTISGHSQTKRTKQSNRHFHHTEKTTAEASTICSIWIDVAQWKTWDTGLKNAAMEEPFKLDALGEIISLEGRKSKFKITELNEGVSYTFKTKLPLSSLYVSRYISEQHGNNHITHEVYFKGLTAGLFSRMFGEKFREMLPEVVRNVVKQAEENTNLEKKQ